MNHGKLTAKVACKLSKKFAGRVDILFDHGNKVDCPNHVGKIHSWFGDKLARNTILANLDIAVILPNPDKAIALIEIEESTASPKTLLGDVFATLWGEHFTFRRKRHLEVDQRTQLIVLFRGNQRNARVGFFANRLNQIKDARIKIVVKAFDNVTDLEDILTHRIEDALMLYQ